MPVVTAAATATAAPRQLSDGNPNGTVMGVATNAAGLPELLGFYGAAPVAQPSGAQLQPVSRGQQAGVVGTFSTTQSPTAVTTITTVESDFTVVTGTGATFLPATGDFWYVNKPTAQAGLGMGNIRQKSAGVVSVNFSNPTNGTVTPTASEVYKLVCLRGVGTFTATLSPAAVAANSVMEQQFSIAGVVGGAGLPVGELVQVSKPTSQAGLDIAGCRIVSSNVLGITFVNVTAAPITPTAAEVYSIFSLAGLDAVNNLIHYGMNMGTIGATGAGVVITGGSTTLTGALATDIVVGIQKPTLQAAATNASMVYPGGSVFTANVFTLGTFGVGTGGTLTGSEVYGITAFRSNPAAPLLNYSQSLAPVSVAANTTAEQTFTVTGLISGTPVWVNKPSWQNGLGIAGVRVSATNTLAINYINTTANAIVPATEVYIIGNFQVPAPGAGNSVYQTVMPAIDDALDTVNGVRAALVPTTGVGLIAAG